MFKYTINYSEDEKLYDILIEKDNKFQDHFKHKNINLIRNNIKNNK